MVEIMASHRPKKVFMFSTGEVLSLDYVSGIMTDSCIRPVSGISQDSRRFYSRKGTLHR